MNLPRLPKGGFYYSEEERFKMALTIAPVVLKGLNESQLDKVQTLEMLPKIVIEFTDAIITELKK